MVDFLRGKFEDSLVLFPFCESSSEMIYNELLVKGKSKVVKPKVILVFRR